MPIQPINYAGMPLLDSPWDQDFGEILKKGMQLGQEPGRLARLKQQEELANKLSNEQYEQLRALTPYAADNARYASEENRVKAAFANPNAQAALKEAIARGALTSEQAKYFGQTARSNIGLTDAQAALTRRSTSLPFSQSMDASNPVQMYNLASQFAKENPNNPELVKDVYRNLERHVAMMQGRNLPPQQRQLMHIRNLYEQKDDPNIDPITKRHIEREIAQNRNQVIREALGPEAHNRLKSASELQESINRALMPRMFKDKNGKIHKGNSMADDLVMYSGTLAKTDKAKDAVLGHKDYERHLAAKKHFENLAHLYQRYEKLSSSEGTTQKTEGMFTGDSYALDPDAAGRNLKKFLNNITRNHQVIADQADRDAGLPPNEFDVHGKRRKTASESYYRGAQSKGAPNISPADKFANSTLPPVDYNEYMKGNR
jgi:hypothetical protein